MTPTYFLAGAQKSATTWIYSNLKKHNQIFVPEDHNINYFNINYYRSIEWYKKWYKKANKNQKLVDPSPTYLRDPFVHKKIYDYNPNSKFIISLRNPIDRAFSHYWHEKKKDNINFKFEDAINYNGVGIYDIFNDWIESGLYYQLIQNLLRFFNQDQILILIFDDIMNNPVQTMNQIYKFLNIGQVDSNQVITHKVNQAGKDKTGSNKQYKKGIKQSTRNQLYKIFESDIQNLSDFLNRNLSHWK